MPPQPLVTAAIVQNGAGASVPFIVGPAWNPGGPNPTFPQFNKQIGLIATVLSGAGTYTVQVTADAVPSAGGNWNNHDILVALQASANSNIQYPVTGIRLVCTGTIVVNLGMCRWS